MGVLDSLHIVSVLLLFAHSFCVVTLCVYYFVNVVSICHQQAGALHDIPNVALTNHLKQNVKMKQYTVLHGPQPNY